MKTRSEAKLVDAKIGGAASPRGALVWAVRFGLAAGVAASVFANAMHAQPSLVGRVIAAWAPLAFFAVVEFLSYMPAGRSLASAIRYVAAGVVGAVAAWVSYWHMTAVASRYGEEYSHLLPLSVDGLIVVTSMCLFELKRRRRSIQPDPVEVVAEASVAAGVPVDLDLGARQPGVYRALGEDPIPPLYIGSTADFPARVRSHKAQSTEWFPLVVRWTFEPYPTLDDALIAERVLVDAEHPIYNRRLIGGLKPQRRAPMPRGVKAEIRPPSVDVASAPPPRDSRPNFPERGSKDGDRDRRDVFARRVVEGGERAADLAKEVGKSKRSIELWVKDYRRRHGLTLGEFTPPAAPDQHVNGAAPEVGVST
jgi:hypothetical protein